MCVHRSCNVCVNTTPVERAVMTVALVITSNHGNQEPSPRETPVKVRNRMDTKIDLPLNTLLFIYNTCLSLTCLSLSECNCHKKAFDCFYNQTVAELSLSLNTHGVYQGGGVCINCQQNTAGINCETCAAGYYRPAEVLTNTVNNTTVQTCWGTDRYCEVKLS